MKNKTDIDPNGKYLRHREKGTIYGWTVALAKSKNVEEVSGKEAYPELFAPKTVTKKKVKPMDFGDMGEEIDENPKVSDELKADASRGLKV